MAVSPAIHIALWLSMLLHCGVVARGYSHYIIALWLPVAILLLWLILPIATT